MNCVALVSLVITRVVQSRDIYNSGIGSSAFCFSEPEMKVNSITCSVQFEFQVGLDSRST